MPFTYLHDVNSILKHINPHVTAFAVTQIVMKNVLFTYFLIVQLAELL